MDRSNIEHSDSESGDSWTLLDNSSNYADDTRDVADHPNASSALGHNDKDDDTDGISIITDSEPDSSSPCQLDNDHYLSEENSTAEHFSKYTPLNSDHSNVKNCHEQEKDNDILGDNTGKHKTYVHRRNKRLSAVLNIVMLGSVITAAGVAIGHMWGARTDCSMHSTTNENKILSNLYKLQEENTYLRGKLKELTAYNYQMNQQKTPYRQNKCKKIFEEPINSNSRKGTKCVDDNVINDNIPLKSHMAKAADEPQRNSKIGGKNKKLEELFRLLQQRYISKNINNPEKLQYLNDLLEIKKKYYEDQKYSDEFMNETNDLRYEMQMYLDTIKYIENIQGNKEQSHDFINDDAWNESNNPKLSEIDIPSSTNHNVVYINDKIVRNKRVERKDNYLNKENKIKGFDGTGIDFSNEPVKNIKRKREIHSNNEFTLDDKQNIKNKENNKTYLTHNDFDINNTTSREYATVDKTMKLDKNQQKNAGKYNYASKRITRKYDINKLKGDVGSKDAPLMKGPNFYTSDIDLRPRGDYGTADEFLNIKEKNIIKDTIEKTVYKTNSDSPKDNYGTEDELKNKDKKIKDQREMDSDEDIKKDNRYNAQKKKQERKKYDRQQAHKKIKRRNKYEQWEMKGGLLKDFDDISWSSSSQESENFDEPILIDDKSFISHFDNIETKIDMSDSQKQENSGKIDELQSTKENNKNEVNWSDKRAILRKMARQRLEQELFGKSSGSTAGWYFRRMRKREQSRGKPDNSTYRKLLKRNMNYKLKK